jgi:hypothetical protein
MAEIALIWKQSAGKEMSSGEALVWQLFVGRFSR